MSNFELYGEVPLPCVFSVLSHDSKPYQSSSHMKKDREFRDKPKLTETDTMNCAIN
jgi:hypothetical protein